MFISDSRVIIEKINFGALLTSIAVILNSFLSYVTADMKISLFEVPILFAGILLGPLYGAFVGFSTDIIYSVTSPHGFGGINYFTLVATLYGLLPGLFFHIFKYSLPKQSLITLFTVIIAFSLTTYQNYLWYGFGDVIGVLPVRVIIASVKLPIQIFLIHFLLTYKGFNQFNLYKLFAKKHFKQ